MYLAQNSSKRIHENGRQTYTYLLVVNSPYPSSIVVGSSQHMLALMINSNSSMYIIVQVDVLTWLSN